MPTVITPEKKPLFQTLQNIPPQGTSLLQGKKRLFILIGLLFFVLLVVVTAVYFLNSSYSEQLAAKVSLFIPFFQKKD